MKTIIFNGEEWQAEKIIKSADSIIGKNDSKEVFSFRGINDFSLFSLEEGHDWDVDELTQIKQQLEVTQEALDFILMNRGV